MWGSGSGDAGARQAGHGPTQWAQSGFQEGVDAVGDHLLERRQRSELNLQRSELVRVGRVQRWSGDAQEKRLPAETHMRRETEQARDKSTIHAEKTPGGTRADGPQPLQHSGCR